MENSINQLPKSAISTNVCLLESYYQTDFNQPGLTEAVRFLVSNVQPEKVFYNPDPFAAFQLLVLLQDKHAQTADKMKKLQDAPQLASFNLKLHYTAGSVFEQNYFWSPVFATVLCTRENLLYDNGFFSLPSMTVEDLLKHKNNAIDCTAKIVSDTKKFIAQAQSNGNPLNFKIVLELHHLAKTCLQSLLQSITGNLIETDDICTLLQQSLSITVNLSLLFKNEERLLQLLNAGSTDSPQGNSTILQDADLKTLLEKLAAMCSITEQTVSKWINRYSQQIVKFTNNTLASA